MSTLIIKNWTVLTIFLKKVPFGSIIYSDYHTVRYFPGKFEKSQSLGVSYYGTKKISNVTSLSSYKGYIVIREQELARNGLYFGQGELESRDTPNYLYAGTPENQIELYSKLELNHKFYSNSAVSIYLNQRDQSQNMITNVIHSEEK